VVVGTSVVFGASVVVGASVVLGTVEVVVEVDVLVDVDGTVVVGSAAAAGHFKVASAVSPHANRLETFHTPSTSTALPTNGYGVSRRGFPSAMTEYSTCACVASSSRAPDTLNVTVPPRVATARAPA